MRAISESQAVKRVVAEFKGKPLRSTTSRVTGAGKKFKLGVGRSINLGWQAARLIQGANPMGPLSRFSSYAGWWPMPHVASKRLAKRIAKKLRQPHRRKDRGPLRARAAGKNEVTRRR